jgi:hypothetical protein
MTGRLEHLDRYAANQFCPGTGPTVNPHRQARRPGTTYPDPADVALAETAKDRELFDAKLDRGIDFRRTEGSATTEHENRLKQAGLARRIQAGDDIQLRSRLEDC